MLAPKRVACVLILFCLMMRAYASDMKERIEKQMRELLAKCPELSYDVNELMDASESMRNGVALPEKYACYFHCLYKNSDKDNIYLDDQNNIIISENTPESIRNQILKCQDGIHEKEPCAMAYKFFTKCIQKVE